MSAIPAISGKLYATKRHPQELLVGGMDRVQVIFDRPYYDPAKRCDGTCFANSPKGWQYPSHTFRGET